MMKIGDDALITASKVQTETCLHAQFT